MDHVSILPHFEACVQTLMKESTNKEKLERVFLMKQFSNLVKSSDMKFHDSFTLHKLGMAAIAA